MTATKRLRPSQGKSHSTTLCTRLIGCSTSAAAQSSSSSLAGPAPSMASPFSTPPFSIPQPAQSGTRFHSFAAALAPVAGSVNDRRVASYSRSDGGPSSAGTSFRILNSGPAPASSSTRGRKKTRFTIVIIPTPVRRPLVSPFTVSPAVSSRPT